MKIVIDIPVEIYIHLLARYKYQNTDDIGLSEFDKVGVSIKNGILLPEHGDLIDKNKLVFNCMSDSYCDHKNCNTCQYKCVAKYEIENAIVLEEVRTNES